jgi:solute carrier family 45 protein 1/2/4
MLNYSSSSIAWFPILFYSTVYIGELHKRASPLPVDSDAAADALEGEANRLGSRALFYSAIISLVTNVILPFFVRDGEGRGGRRRTCFERMQVSMVTIWTTSYAVFVGCMAATL